MKLLKIETFNETSEVEGEVITVTRYRFPCFCLQIVMDCYGNRTFSKKYFNFGNDNVEVNEMFLFILERVLIIKKRNVTNERDYYIRGTEF